MHLTTRDARVAADKLASAMEAALDRLLTRIPHGTVGARRPRGRGGALTTLDQMTVMFFAAAYGDGPKAIARTLGMHRRTVKKVLNTTVYRKFREQAMLTTLNRIYGRRGRW